MGIQLRIRTLRPLCRLFRSSSFLFMSTASRFQYEALPWRHEHTRRLC